MAKAKGSIGEYYRERIALSGKLIRAKRKGDIKRQVEISAKIEALEKKINAIEKGF
ncbi:MAG: hypothetical protein LBD46_04685 [Endomicrobium sp.]|nr:hypothetical protein [Endomicrobium sp.]